VKKADNQNKAKGRNDDNKKFRIWPENKVKNGESIAKIMTEIWNSQKKPGKVYVRGYRVHHGAIGFIGALACKYFDKPTAYGFFKHLMDDDRNDWHEWFSGEKLPKDAPCNLGPK
jgi:hypothetical protein